MAAELALLELRSAVLRATLVGSLRRDKPAEAL